jgi:hypothetical protein
VQAEEEEKSHWQLEEEEVKVVAEEAETIGVLF